MLQLEELRPSRAALLRAIDADIAEVRIELDQPMPLGARRRFIAGAAVLGALAAVAAVGFAELPYAIEGPEDGGRSTRTRRTGITVGVLGPTLLITALVLLVRGSRIQNEAEAPAVARYRELRLRRREIQRLAPR